MKIHQDKREGAAQLDALNQYIDRVNYGDCIAVMRGIRAASVDFALTDPPYLVNYVPRDRRAIANDDRNSWLQPAFAEIYRLLKPNGFCFSFYGWPQVEQFMVTWKALGFSPVSHFVLIKEYPSRKGYAQSHHETAYLLVKGRPQQPAEPLSDVLQFDYTGNTLHPNQKPVEALQRLIETYCPAGGVVLDPFAGSGSTGIAARNCGRRFILIEKLWRYHRSAQERIKGNRLPTGRQKGTS